MTANNNRAKSACLVSVYSKIDEQGVITKGAKLYSGASDKKKYDLDKTLAQYTGVKIVGKCKGYYYISYEEAGKLSSFFQDIAWANLIFHYLP